MSNWRKTVFCALVALALVVAGNVALSPAAHAQAGLSTGTIQGTILDAKGGSVAGAKVTIASKGTGAKITAEVTSSGTYNSGPLVPGQYVVRVEAAGFKAVEETFTVQVGKDPRVGTLDAVGEKFLEQISAVESRTVAVHWNQTFVEADLLFSGDHVMAWSTPVVAPPDGAMSDYMASLRKLARRSEPIYLPGHGGLVREAPQFVQHYIHHRQGREAAILRRLAKGEADIPTLVRGIYVGLDPRLVKAAGLSVLAHLEDLVTRGLVTTAGEPSSEGRYRLG